jgi:hypothetical protein
MHGPTNLYMLYPMEQSVVLVCVEKVKKMPLQWHCLLSVYVDSDAVHLYHAGKACGWHARVL